MSLEEYLKKVKRASEQSLKLSNSQRNLALNKISKAILKNEKRILGENQKDLEEASAAGLSSAMIDRLKLSPQRIVALAETAKTIAEQEDVVGKITQSQKRADGLEIKKQRIPLGVIAMIFESRPNVVVDCSCLAIKSGNAMILKGGKEAKHSNRILSDIIIEATKEVLPAGTIFLIEDREDVASILKAREYIDLIIPRGGEKLIEYVYRESKSPVVAHFKGNCHVYIHEDASIDEAKNIVVNAKLQRPGVCNAMESLLIHENISTEAQKGILMALSEAGCELRLEKKLMELNIPEAKLATPQDFATEFLESILSVKLVNSLEEACSHIAVYGSKHTEAILTKSNEVAQQFSLRVDASCIMHNASTRFNDGGELGLGAELGISTTKFHAYGPMGAREMTCERFLVVGEGHCRK